MNVVITRLKQNWKSALSVALVSVPLSLSLGIAAGASPVAGIVTAIWAGLIAGIFGGSNFNIVGPAGALSGILAADALLYGPSILPLIAIVSGLIILVVWVLKWDRYLIFIPSSVVHGFTLGVALTIGFGQLNFAFGLRNLPSHQRLIENIVESLRHVGQVEWTSFIPFVMGLWIMFALLRFKPRWPNTVFLAVLGIIFGYLASTGVLPFTVPTLFTKYGNLSLQLFSMPRLTTSIFTPVVIQMSAVVAFVVVLETLISAKVADGMTKTKFNQRREVFGVGLANIVSGFFGGIPASGVFARTSINVRSGATSSWSQITNAFFIALIALVFLRYFKFLPLSIIAAILVFAAIRMITKEHFQKLYRYDRVAFWNAMAIAAMTLVYDATAGILVGALVALLVFARRLSNAQSNVTIEQDGDQVDVTTVTNEEGLKGSPVIYRFAGVLTYLNAKSHMERLQKIASDKAIILNFRNLSYIDCDGVEALDEVFEDLNSRAQTVYVTGISGHMVKVLETHEWFEALAKKQRVLQSTNDALVLIQGQKG